MKTKKQQGPVASDKSSLVARLPHACRDERAAVEFIEEQRWGDEPYCPHCGSVNECYIMRDRKTGERNSRYLWRCRACAKQFTVRVGTIMEDSPIPLRHWCLAFWLGCASKKGVSALQIKRLTGLTYTSALFMMHRVRLAMSTDHTFSPPLKGVVEADETYVGGKPRHRARPEGVFHRLKLRPRADAKTPVLAILQRGGELRPFQLQRIGSSEVKALVRLHVDRSAMLMTDEAPVYRQLGPEFAAHGSTMHSRHEYVRVQIHSSTVEGFFSLLKRGVYGTFHSISRKHLHRYLSEFEFRYNTRKMDDGARTALAIKRAAGKRLTYRGQVNGQKGVA